MGGFGMDVQMVQDVLSGTIEDTQGLRFYFEGMIWSGRIGLGLLWIAAALTLITGVDYLKKALPYLKETR